VVGLFSMVLVGCRVNIFGVARYGTNGMEFLEVNNNLCLRCGRIFRAKQVQTICATRENTLWMPMCCSHVELECTANYITFTDKNRILYHVFIN
jgi:hypothetical protein